MKGSLSLTDYSTVEELIEVAKNCPKSVYLERLAYLIKRETLSTGDLERANEAISILKALGRSDLVESIQEKYLAVKTAGRILKAHKLEAVYTTSERVIGTYLVGLDSDLISERTLLIEGISRSIQFCYNQKNSAVIRLIVRGKTINLKVDPNSSADKLLLDLETAAGHPLCDYRVFLSSKTDLSLLLSQSLAKSKKSAKNIAFIFENNLVIINPSDTEDSISVSFRSKLINIS